ncbi:Lsr2 family protein [Nonomuraea sp. K274]|uniref:Lsr2 family protein n=1 Tax=Nonomuraea cypriaca TaxID=1187855 RepID=A0A931A6P6_9ACTN|nr:histone-like nucleoid-structuring protein Lsr2 [Nonomuraea cypriaca]MBF8187361.1 Lsr2 family protein [Nonomuraea cypriaca]
MTVDRLTPDAVKVLRMLAARKTTQEAAASVSWPRDRVVGLARAQKGWFLSAETDTVSDPGSPDGTVRLPDGVERAGQLTFEIALTKAEASNDPKLRRLAATARKTHDELMERLINQHQAAAVARDIEQLQQELQAKQARHRELTGRRQPGPRVAEPSAPAAKVKRAGIRAWAASQGLDCPAAGRIPKTVEAAYDEAHGGNA